MYGGYSYTEYDYEPTDKDFVVLAWVSGRKDLEVLAEAVAAETSVGTWVRISTMNDYVFEHYRARVFKIHRVTDSSGFVWMAYPLEHFEKDNLLQFQASVLGNVFGMAELREYYVFDISFPEKYQKNFPGPGLGLEGIRKKMGVKDRPLTGTIVKPKVGLAPQEFAEVAYRAWKGGLDLVKDDENLINQDFCPWKERFDLVFEKLDKAETETGEKKTYSTNITDSSIERMEERLDYVHERGHKTVMLDVYVLGFSALNHMVKRARKYGIFVHGHRAGYAAHHRGNYGVNFQVYEKIYRMIGVDMLHVGAGLGKMEDDPLEIKRLHDVASEMEGEEKLYLGSLEFQWADHIKPMFPIASGGLDPARVEAVMALHGKDVIIQAGGGVHGHPDGTYAGAVALRKAVDAVSEGKSLLEVKDKIPELKGAFEKFKYIDPEKVRRIFKLEEEYRDLLTHLAMKTGRTGIQLIMEDLNVI